MEHQDRAERLIEFVREMGVARSSDINRAGYPRVLLTRAVNQGRLQRVDRGLYSVVEHELTEWHDLAEIAKAVPNAVIGLISALAFHQIGTQMPYEHWIVLPAKAWEPTGTRRFRTTRFAEPYYSAGIEEHVIEGVSVRIYSPAKTVADCFRMRSKVGFDVAIEALREGWRTRKFTMDELDKYAKLNKVRKVMRPYIEAITS